MQATAVTQETTVTPATSHIKDDSNIMTAHNSRNEATTGPPTQYEGHQKKGILANTVKPAIAWREANSSRNNRNVIPSTEEGRTATTRMPEIVETSQQQYYHQQGRQ